MLLIQESNGFTVSTIGVAETPKAAIDYVVGQNPPEAEIWASNLLFKRTAYVNESLLENLTTWAVIIDRPYKKYTFTEVPFIG